jgi:phage-related protein
VKKEVVFDSRALKEFNELELEVKKEFGILIDTLEVDGKLSEPEAKKLDKNLYEIRVRIKTAWRGFYAYISNNRIIILRIFQKQSQSTPEREIKTANQRLKEYK